MDIEQLATSKVIELISRTGRLTADVNAMDKKPIWDGFVHVYDAPADRHKKRDYRASLPVQVKGTTRALVRDGDRVQYELETDDLNAYLTNRPTVFFVVAMDETGAHRTVYHRVFRQEDVNDILSTLKAGQMTKTLSFSPLPTEPDELERLFLALADAPCAVRPAPAVSVSVGDPFLYDAGTVPFLGRDAELDALDGFLHAAGGLRWWGVAAAGGAGKTRLAYEWGLQSQARGWSVRWLRGRDYDAPDQWSDPAAPTLLIADYAWQHAEALGKWMDELCRSEPYHPVRVLLLERDEGEENGEYPWEKRLYRAGGEARLRRARHSRMLRLDALDDDPLRDLMKSFAASLRAREPELPALPDGEDAVLLARLRAVDPLRRPLFAMLLTDAVLRGAGVPDSQEALLENLAIREKDRRLGAVRTLTGDAAQRNRLERLGGALRLLATALGADGDPGAERLAALLPGEWKALADCAERLGLLSPEALLLELGLLRVADGALRVPALRPDLLGEYALLRALRDCVAVERPRRDALYAAALGEGALLRQLAQRLLNDYAPLLNRRPELWARLFPRLPELPLSRAAPYSNLLYDAFGRCTNREQRRALLENMEQCAAGIREETADAGTVCNNLGLLYHHLGDYGKALEYHKKALTIRKTVLDAKHPSIATSYNNLGTLYHAMGNLPKAAEALKKALMIWQAVLGAEHPATATSCNNLGMVYHAMGDLPKALEYCQRALRIREAVLGAEHPDTATSCNNLGTVYYAMGDLPKALEYHQRALRIRETVLGAEHPDTAGSCYNLSFVYRDMRNLPEALRYAERALSIWQTVLGAEHPHTKLAWENVDYLTILTRLIP